MIIEPSEWIKVPDDNGDVYIKEGSIISCVYWVQGWPAEENTNESK